MLTKQVLSIYFFLFYFIRELIVGTQTFLENFSQSFLEKF